MKRELVAACLLFAAPAFAGTFHVVSSTTSTAHGLDHSVTVVQNGSDPLYRFHVDRVVEHGANGCDLRGAIILTPALGNNATLYTVGDDPGGADLQHSIAGNLAKEGLDVYIYSPPQSFFAPGYCNSNDCSIMAGWGMAGAPRRPGLHSPPGQATSSGDRKPIIAGLSLGGMTALAAVNQNPHAYSGMVDLDGILLHRRRRPRRRATSRVRLRTAIAAGQVCSTDQLGLRPSRRFSQLSLADPNGLSPVPGFPPGTTNRGVHAGAGSCPRPAHRPRSFPSGFLLAAGDVATQPVSSRRKIGWRRRFPTSTTTSPTPRWPMWPARSPGDPTFNEQPLDHWRRPSLVFKQQRLRRSDQRQRGGARRPGAGHRPRRLRPRRPGVVARPQEAVREEDQPLDRRRRRLHPRRS